MDHTPPFRSFFMAGFECACQRTFAGDRLNITVASGHERFAYEDFARARERGIRTVRDGLQWPVVETRPGRYDFSSVLPVVDAARAAGTQVLWDLCHFGWPDDLDVFSADFVERLAGLARAFVPLIDRESDEPPVVNPVNEISYFAWAGGQVGYFHPGQHGRGDELKRQLVRATIAAIDAVREVCPRARFLNTDPLVVVHPRTSRDRERALAVRATQRQFEARDMLVGRTDPDLGGDPRYLDIVGVCYYDDNQWLYDESIAYRLPLSPDDRRSVPLRELLAGLHARYGRPMLLAETSAEHDARAPWLRRVCHEVGGALRLGVPIGGICWYPILNHPGWDDDRPCQHGLWDVAGEHGERRVYEPLAAELLRQQLQLGQPPSRAAGQVREAPVGG